MFISSTNTQRYGLLAAIFLLIICSANAVSANAEQPSAQQAEASQQLMVNVNQATAEELSEALIGVGLAKAKAIVEYRNQNGPFKSVAELGLVKGIGEATLDKNAGRIRLK